MSEDAVRRQCETGALRYAEKVGGRWFINYDRTMGRAAPARAQAIDVDELSERVASKLLLALSNGLAGISGATQSSRR